MLLGKFLLRLCPEQKVFDSVSLIEFSQNRALCLHEERIGQRFFESRKGRERGKALFDFVLYALIIGIVDLLFGRVEILLGEKGIVISPLVERFLFGSPGGHLFLRLEMREKGVQVAGEGFVRAERHGSDEGMYETEKGAEGLFEGKLASEGDWRPHGDG